MLRYALLMFAKGARKLERPELNVALIRNRDGETDWNLQRIP